MEMIFNVFILAAVMSALLLTLGAMELVTKLIPERWVDKLASWLDM